MVMKMSIIMKVAKKMTRMGIKMLSVKDHDNDGAQE